MNLNLRIEINSGAASIIYMVGFFGVLLLSNWIPAVATNVVGIEGAWTLGFGGYLAKRGHDGKVEIEKLKIAPCNGEAK